MNMRTIDFGFTKVDIDANNKRRHNHEVWFNFDDRHKPSKVLISADLLEGAIKIGDRIELMQSDDRKTLAFHKVTYQNAFTIHKYGNTGVISSRILAMNMRTNTRVQYHLDTEGYNAQLIDDYIILTPKEINNGAEK